MIRMREVNTQLKLKISNYETSILNNGKEEVYIIFFYIYIFYVFFYHFIYVWVRGR